MSYRGGDRFYQHRPLSDASSQIRIINLLPTTEPDEITCSLGIHSLDEEPFYIAVSHTWGEPEPTVEICVDGKAYEIRLKLFQLLQHLQTRKQSLAKGGQFRLWIDAISIAQNDIEDQKGQHEKSAQVATMGRIFRQAHQVIAWLGWGEDVEPKETFRFIKSAASDQDMQELGIEAQKLAWFEKWVAYQSESAWFSGNHLDVHWRRLERFLWLPYWSRRWIIQEILLARDVVILCGHEELSWIILAALLQKLNDSKLRAHGLVEEVLRRRCVYEEIRSSVPSRMELYKSKLNAKQQSDSIDSLLTTFGDTKCEVVQDRIYALRSLTSRGLTIQPDYTCSIPVLLARILPASLEGGFDPLLITNFASILDLPLSIPTMDLKEGPLTSIMWHVHSSDLLHVLVTNVGLDTEEIPTALKSLCEQNPDLDNNLAFHVKNSNVTISGRQQLVLKSTIAEVGHYAHLLWRQSSKPPGDLPYLILCHDGSLAWSCRKIRRGDFLCRLDKRFCFALRFESGRFKILGAAVIVMDPQDWEDLSDDTEQDLRLMILSVNGLYRYKWEEKGSNLNKEVFDTPPKVDSQTLISQHFDSKISKAPHTEGLAPTEFEYYDCFRLSSATGLSFDMRVYVNVFEAVELATKLKHLSHLLVGAGGLDGGAERWRQQRRREIQQREARWWGKERHEATMFEKKLQEMMLWEETLQTERRLGKRLHQEKDLLRKLGKERILKKRWKKKELEMSRLRGVRLQEVKIWEERLTQTRLQLDTMIVETLEERSLKKDKLGRKRSATEMSQEEMPGNGELLQTWLEQEVVLLKRLQDHSLVLERLWDENSWDEAPLDERLCEEERTDETSSENSSEEQGPRDLGIWEWILGKLKSHKAKGQEKTERVQHITETLIEMELDKVKKDVSTVMSTCRTKEPVLERITPRVAAERERLVGYVGTEVEEFEQNGGVNKMETKQSLERRIEIEMDIMISRVTNVDKARGTRPLVWNTPREILEEIKKVTTQYSLHMETMRGIVDRGNFPSAELEREARTCLTFFTAWADRASVVGDAPLIDAEEFCREQEEVQATKEKLCHHLDSYEDISKSSGDADGDGALAGALNEIKRTIDRSLDRFLRLMEIAWAIVNDARMY